MERLRQESARGRTIVLTTQILSEAEELCDDILIMRAGRQAARGDINTLKLLSGGLYEISVTFAELPDSLEAGARGVSPDSRSTCRRIRRSSPCASRKAACSTSSRTSAASAGY